MKKWLLTLAVVSAFLALLAAGLGRNPQELPSVLLGEPLPELEVPLPQSAYFLVNVWGSWCPACYQEHDYLLELSKKIPIIGLNWAANNPREDEEAAAFLQRLGNPYQAVQYAGNGRIITDLGVYGAPETFLVDAQRRIIHRHAGPLNAEVWAREFVPKMEPHP